MSNDKNSKLKKYQNKRNFTKTSEPKGEKTVRHGKHIFVVQHHEARRDHYDFRLEVGGVLVSFAIPKGPSYNIKDRRLAVHVEDHPYDYKDFEGVIPQGEYGGGTVMLWDEGFYESIGSPKEALKKGSWKFKLFGQRLKGAWTLVKYKKDNWLLIKENDGVIYYDDIAKITTSIKTNRTMFEIREGRPAKKSKNSRCNHIVENVEISNPDKIIFTKPNITKYDIALYYRRVAERMLPYLSKRLISTVRAPAGVAGEKFFAKHNLAKTEGIVEFDIPNKKMKNDYYHIVSTRGLISEVQMNSYEFHIWGSRIPEFDKPDVLVFDLDPDANLPLKDVRQGVKDLKSILDKLKLTSFLKTSGGKGYHVVVPIKRFTTWSEAGEFAENVAKLMEESWPDKYVSSMSKNKRTKKIFIDYFRNARESTSVAPYSIRLKNKCRVSMPIKWSELDKVGPADITIEKAIKRLKRKDPWEGFLESD